MEIGPGAEWLTASPPSGSLPANLQIAASANALRAGVHNGSVQVTSGVHKATLAVTLEVREVRSGKLKCEVRPMGKDDVREICLNGGPCGWREKALHLRSDCFRISVVLQEFPDDFTTSENQRAK